MALIKLNNNSISAVTALPAGVGGNLVKITDETTVTSAATLELDLDNSIYKSFRLIIKATRPITDGGALRIRVSTDGGSTFLSGSNDYSFVIQEVEGSSGDNTEHNSKATSYCQLSKGGEGNQSVEGGAYDLFIVPKPPNSGATANVRGNYWWWNGYRNSNTGIFIGLNGVGQIYNNSQLPINAIQIFYGAGNINYLTYMLYGVV